MTAVEGERAAGPPIDDADAPQEQADTVASSSGDAVARESDGDEPTPVVTEADHEAENEAEPSSAADHPEPEPENDDAEPSSAAETHSASAEPEPVPVEPEPSAEPEPASAAGSAPTEVDREPDPVPATPHRDEPAPAPAAARPRRRRRRAILAPLLLALLLTLGGGAVGAWAALTFRPDPPPSPPAAAPAPIGLLAAVDAVTPAVLRIQTGEPETGTAGTALIVTPTGDVVTNEHLVHGETTATLIHPDGRTDTAQVVAADENADLAWLRIDGTQGLPTVRLAGPASVRPGEDVVAIGNALNLDGPPSITRGIVSAVGRSTSTLTDVIQTDAAISSGSSGGALIDGSGTVVGVTTEALVGDPTVSVEDIAFAIPADRVVTVLRGMGLVLPPG